MINLIQEVKFLVNVDFGLFDSLIPSTISYMQKLQSNFTLTDLQNFMYGITLLRFFLYSFLYDVKTGFSISCISFLAAKLWYSHAIYVLKGYRSTIRHHSLTKSLWISYMAQEKQTASLQDYAPSKMMDTFLKQLLGNDIVSEKNDLLKNSAKSYRIDPISMIFSILPKGIRTYSDRIYYTFWNSIGPAIFRIIRANSFVSKMVFSYLFIVRIYKKRCPYLIRWHWTCVLLFTILIQLFRPIPLRLEEFAQLVLLPQQRFSDYYLANSIIGGLVLSHLSFVLLALFHALLGQYFYIPFLTENVELHIGKRPEDSIYSGGYAAWQDYDLFLNIQRNSKFKRKNFFPKIWWGWFGRGDQPIISKKRKRKRRKIFKKLNKFLKILFSKFT